MKERGKRQSIMVRKLIRSRGWFRIYMECPHMFEMPQRRKQLATVVNPASCCYPPQINAAGPTMTDK